MKKKTLEDTTLLEEAIKNSLSPEEFEKHKKRIAEFRDTMRICRNCEFVEMDHPIIDEEGTEGEPYWECHRYPPTVDTSGKDLLLFPEVPPAIWCGEFKLKKKKVPPIEWGKELNLEEVDP